MVLLNSFYSFGATLGEQNFIIIVHSKYISISWYSYIMQLHIQMYHEHLFSSFMSTTKSYNETTCS